MCKTFHVKYMFCGHQAIKPEQCESRCKNYHPKDVERHCCCSIICCEAVQSPLQYDYLVVHDKLLEWQRNTDRGPLGDQEPRWNVSEADKEQIMAHWRSELAKCFNAKMNERRRHDHCQDARNEPMPWD
jgi:hypothetical protein